MNDKTFCEITIAGRSYTVNFFYDWAGADGIVASNIPVTTCVIHGPGGAFAGVAVCHPDDNIRIKTGKCIAFKRAAKQLQDFLAMHYRKYQHIFMCVGDPIVDEAFRAYRLAMKSPEELKAIQARQQKGGDHEAL